jgi:hypothetical protein
MSDLQHPQWLRFQPALLLRLLGDMLSDMSQAAMYAVWQDGTQRRIQEMVAQALATGEAQTWGDGAVVTPAVALFMQSAADLLGGWPVLNPDADDPPYVIGEE